MKVVQINCIYGTSSTGRTSKELAIELERNGHEAYMAYSSGKCDLKNKYLIGNTVDHKSHAFLSRFFGLQGYFSSFYTKKLLKYINSIKPDVVHLRNLHSNYININMLLKLLADKNIATVVTLHDCFLYTGKCTHYTVDNCYKWKEKCGNCPRLKKDNKSLFFDRTSKILSDRKKYFGAIKKLAVIGVSDWITEEAKKSVLKNAQIIYRIYNWIDFEVFNPSKSDLRTRLQIEDKFVILCVASSFSTGKGIDNIVALSKKIPYDCCIVLVGKVDEGIIDYTDKIISVGVTDSVQELAQYYSMADCTISCSLEETFGKTIAESLACGTPAVVYNSTALPELIGENCGFVAERGNIEDMALKIKDIKNLGKEHFSEFCIKYANENFGMKKNINDYIEIYKKLISYEGKI